jgi:hypothetical protein
LLLGFPGVVLIVLNLGVGYKLPYGFRAEVEGGYAHYVLTNISPMNDNPLVLPKLIGTRLNLMSGGERDQYSATLNAFYDLPGVAGLVEPLSSHAHRK